MLAVFSELLIAVIFVKGAEALWDAVTTTILPAHAGYLRLAALYVLPVVALLFQSVQLAHYHLKLNAWKEVKRVLERKINGLMEALLVASSGLSFVGLILVSMSLTDPGKGQNIIFFWIVVYAGYLAGDCIIQRCARDELRWEPHSTPAVTAVDAVRQVDGGLLGVGVMLLMCHWGNLLWRPVRCPDVFLAAYSAMICLSVVGLYYHARRFLLAEPDVEDQPCRYVPRRSNLHSRTIRRRLCPFSGRRGDIGDF